MSWKVLIPDFGLSPKELETKYEKRGEYPTPELSAWGWRQRVASDSTRLGYWEWVAEQLLEAQYELDQDNPYA